MINSTLQFTSVVFLAGSLLLVVFLATRVWRDRSVKSVLLLFVDLMFVSMLPIAVVSWVSLGSEAIERLLFAGFLFYLTTCVCFLLFPSTCERYSLPVASLYLVFGALQSLLTFLGDGDSGLQLATFVYRLIDGVTVATLCELFVTEFAPTYKHISSRLATFVSSRMLDSTSKNVHVARANDSTTFPSRVREDKYPETHSRFLKTALSHLREGEFRSCIESCDSGVEDMMVTTMLRLSPARLESPMPIEEQVSRLTSNGIPIRGKRIIQLRRMRNRLTVSCKEGTLDQAKLAIKVLRTTVKAIGDFERTISTPVDGA